MKTLLDRILDLMRRELGEPLTEEEVRNVLIRHKCYGLLDEIPRSDGPRGSDALQKALNVNNIRVRYQTCASFFRKMEENKIPYAVHKGAVLSLVLYGNESVRQSGDLDLLIRRDDADQVKRLLCSEGFVQGRITGQGIMPFTRDEILYHTVNTHQLAPFVKRTDNPLCPYVNVDVNTELLWGESKAQTDMALVLSDVRCISVCGVPIRKLAKETEFIALCLHHYKDMNSLYLLSGNGLKLGLFCDLYDYMHSEDLDPVRLLELCNLLSVAPYVRRCIADTIRVVGEDSVMRGLLNAFTGDGLSDTFGLADTEIRPWGVPLPDRIFIDVPMYLETMLSPEEREKIRWNRTIMQ